MQSYISREQDYALRITAYLAGQEEKKYFPVSEIANKLFISKNFASRIVHTLKKNGIIGTIQGKYGGIFLNKDPHNLTVYEILNVIGFKIKFNLCLDGEFKCQLNGMCSFHKFFYEQEKSIINNLKSKKLSEFKLEF